MQLEMPKTNQIVLCNRDELKTYHDDLESSVARPFYVI